VLQQKPPARQRWRLLIFLNPIARHGHFRLPQLAMAIFNLMNRKLKIIFKKPDNKMSPRGCQGFFSKLKETICAWLSREMTPEIPAIESGKANGKAIG
jgi:hypothetical protein